MSGEVKDGGPAFPNTVRIDNEEFASLRGMTLRDYFAAKVMPWALSDTPQGHQFYSRAAKKAHDIADAMLAAREAK